LSFLSFKLNDSLIICLSIFKAFYTLHLSYGLGSLSGVVKVIKLKSGLIVKLENYLFKNIINKIEKRI
jgi:hypothetical protein